MEQGREVYNIYSDDNYTGSDRNRSEIREADSRLEELEAQMQTGNQRKERIQRYTHVEHLTHEMVEILLNYIIVGKQISGTHEVPVEIYWNF